jgi:cobalamin synthase
MFPEWLTDNPFVDQETVWYSLLLLATVALATLIFDPQGALKITALILFLLALYAFSRAYRDFREGA